MVRGYVSRDSDTTELNNTTLSFYFLSPRKETPQFDLADVFSVWRDQSTTVPAAEQGTMQIRLISIRLSALQLKRELDQAEVMKIIRGLANRT